MQSDAPARADVVAFGPFLFDRDGGILSRGDDEIPATPKAVAVLECLLERPGSTVTKERLLDRVWHGTTVTEHSLIETISRLRQALGDNPHEPLYIRTIPRRGYRFVALVQPVVTRVSESRIGADTVPSKESEGLGAWGRVGARVPIASSMRWIGVVALAVITVFGAISLLGFPPWGDRTVPGTVRFTMSFPEDESFGFFDLSADGRRVVYDRGQLDPATRASWHEQGRTSAYPRFPLFLRELGRFDAIAIPGTEGGEDPVFSPDGARVAFWDNTDPDRPATLRTTALDGSDRRDLLTLRQQWWPQATTWGDDGYIYHFGTPTGRERAIYRIPERGGEPERVITPELASENGHRFLQVLPDDAGLLFTVLPVSGAPEDHEIVVASTSSGARRTVVRGQGRARYLPSGHLLYARSGQTHLRKLNLETLELEGPEITIHELPTGTFGPPPFSVSRTGALVYRIEPPGGLVLSSVAWTGEARPLPIVQPSGACHTPDITSNGKTLLATCEGDLRVAAADLNAAASDLYVADLDSGTMQRRTFEGGVRWAVWMPDGRGIAYSSYTEGEWSLRRIQADGDGGPQVLMRSANLLSPEGVTPDGDWLIYQELHPETGEDLWVLPTDGSGPARPLIVRNAHDSGAEISPDGRWLAYHSNVEGDREWHVFVTSFPDVDPATATKVSTRTGGWPQWNPEGTGLLYLLSQGEAIMGLERSTDGAFGPPRELFAARDHYSRTRRAAAFRLAPDGEGVLVSVSELPARSLRVVVNWLDAILEASR